MKVEVTHTVVYDLDEIMPEFVESQGDYDLSLPALHDFIVDRFINPNFDTDGNTNVRIIDPYEVYVYETDDAVYCSNKCAGFNVAERVLVSYYNYPNGITCPACNKVVQYKLGKYTEDN